MNAVLETLRFVMKSKGISEYKLAKLSSVSQSTINSFFNKNNIPSVPTLELICKGLDISVAQFFLLVEHLNNASIQPSDSFDKVLDQVHVHENIDPIPLFATSHLEDQITKLNTKERQVVSDLVDLIINGKE
ncbi:MAG TPA: helix-turn-helix transcriptional regulator [Erysipelothrix sp.]|nr:helix-turn-helix transcriptional regulator [Erysipelothrix sp.]